MCRVMSASLRSLRSIRLLRSFAPIALFVAASIVTQRTLGAQRPEVWAFTGPWDTHSDASLREHGGRLDAVVTGWIGLDSSSALPLLPSPYPDTIRLLERTRAGPRRMAIVTSWHGQRFHPETIRRLARDRALLARVSSAVASHAEAMRYRGMVLDFEALGASDLDALVGVVRAMTDSLHARGVSPIVLAIPAGDTAGYPARALLGAADLLLVMLYDQHWSGGEPGPIADPEWVRSMVALRVREAGAGRLIAGLPTYGYRWIQGRPTESLSYAEAQRIATRTGVRLARDPTSQTLRASRRGEWELWVTDARQLRSLRSVVRQAGVSRVAYWRLGQEDPEIWNQ